MVQRLGLRRAQARARVARDLRELPVLDRVGPGLLGAALLLAVGRDVAVGHDAVQPRPHVRARGEAVLSAERLDEGVLDQVLGVVRVAGHPQRAAVEGVQVRERLGLEVEVRRGIGLLRGGQAGPVVGGGLCLRHHPQTYATRDRGGTLQQSGRHAPLPPRHPPACSTVPSGLRRGRGTVSAPSDATRWAWGMFLGR